MKLQLDNIGYIIVLSDGGISKYYTDQSFTCLTAHKALLHLF